MKPLALGAAALVTWSAALAAQIPPLAGLGWTDEQTPQIYRGRLAGGGAPEVRVHVAMRHAPGAWRREVAFHRLASALGSDLVPRTELRAVPLGDLVRLLRDDPAGLSRARALAIVLNDGTVPVVVSDVARGVDVSLVGADPEVDRWRAWAEADAPPPPDGAPLASAWVQALVLDYLAGHVGRKSARWDAASRTVRLADNAGAFREHPDPRSLDAGTLEPLRRCRRFPRALVGRLRALDRPAADALLRAGSYWDWLVAPRTVAYMMERRRTVLSLVDTRVAEAGETVALGLP